jgi:membrane protein DedA with SNARE-associated domain
MMEHSLHLINSFLDRLFIYGPIWIYLALFAAAFIENILPPFPGDMFTVAGGALSAAGRLNIILVFLVIYLGGISSMMVIYYFGANYGREFFLKKNYPFFSANDILKLEAWFARKGAPLLIFNRFVVGGRALIGLVAGIGRYNPVRMCLFTSISFWLFNSILLFSSYIFVVKFETIAYYFHLYERTVWPIIIILVVAFIIVKLLRMRRNEEK